MKTLKFRNSLVEEIRAGRKTATWRLFDEKDLRMGDEVELIIWESGEKFAEAQITNVREKKLGEVVEADFDGHEKYPNTEAMFESYRKYYGDKVTADTIVKMIDFKILRFLE